MNVQIDNSGLSMRAMHAMQTGDGVGVAEMMASGASFMDIILQVICNNGEDSEEKTVLGGEYANMLNFFTPEFFQNIDSEAMQTLMQTGTVNLNPEMMNFENLSQITDLSQLLRANAPTETIDYSAVADDVMNQGILEDATENPDTFSNNFSKQTVMDVSEGSNTVRGEVVVNTFGNARTNQDSESFSENGEFDFQRTVNSLKDKVNTDDTSAKKEETFDYAAMQRNADLFDVRSNIISAMSKDTTIEDVEAPSKQLYNSVKENIGKGINEFTVKLKPEGLGEIIVKLVQDDSGKMLLSMAASNVDTAKLLSRDIATLQSSLSQYNVEIVNQTDNTENVAPMSPAFEQYYGHSNEEANQNQYKSESGRHSFSFAGDISAVEEIEEEATKLSSELDVLI